MRNFKALYRAAGFALAAAAALQAFPRQVLAQQTFPLEEKARYERALEMKVEEILLRLLGPNQAKVVINATMDFTKVEKMQLSSGAGDADRNSMFKWQNIASQGQDAGVQHLLPGFPVASPLNPMAAETQAYEKHLSFPPNFVKKLNVSVILSKDIANVDAENIRVVVSDLLGLDAKRGDDIVILKAPFAPFWKTIWYAPESLALVFKYTMLTFMGIVAMVVVAIGFLKLAAAMNGMAKAQQAHQINMDLSGGPGGAGEEPAALPGAEKPALAHDGADKGGGEAGTAELVFNVKLEQVPTLVHMIGSEDPANIALVTAHLAPEVKTEFLKNLPPEITSEIVASMAEVRFVEPDVIMTLKDELEHRLSGAVGGIAKVMDVVDKVGLRAKTDLLKRLEERHPEVARTVRARLFLFEDVARLSDKDLSILISAVKIEDWAAAAWEMDEELKGRIKAQMADKTWQMLEQTMQFGRPPREKTDQAMTAAVEAALSLIQQGRISAPPPLPVMIARETPPADSAAPRPQEA